MLGETTITTGVARILSSVKEGIKIQLEGINLYGIDLRVGGLEYHVKGCHLLQW